MTHGLARSACQPEVARVERGFRSGAIFDAPHVLCAERADAAIIVTANVTDFQRLVADDGPRIVPCDTAPDALRRSRS